MTPKSFVDSVMGKYIDTDNYPRSNPYQCWDLFDYFCRLIGFTGSRHCSSTGYVGDLWMLRDADGYNYSTMFDYIYDPKDIRDGDWVFWSKHVAMFMSPDREIGQNQNGVPYVTEMTMHYDGVLGAMRYKYWQTYNIPYGYSVLTINDHKYTMRRMTGPDKIAVLAAEPNNLLPFEKYDAEVLINAKIGGGNYFQNDPDNPDGRPFGEWYGDVSAPLTGSYHCVSNQNTTLFYDLDTGLFGDVGGVNIDSSHNVFSPSLVFPNSKGHWEYAVFLGLGQKDYKSWYTFVVRFADGYSLGVAGQEMTPQEIVDDFKETEMVNIAFLDGGGSAQAAFWHDEAMDYVRKTTRELPSVIAIYRDFEPVTPETPVVTPDEPVETPVEDHEVPTIIVDEKEDEMDKPVTIAEQIAKLIDVKSIITFALIGTLCYLNIEGKPVDQQFMTVVTAVVTFYFSYKVQKGGKSDG